VIKRLIATKFWFIISRKMFTKKWILTKVRVFFLNFTENFAEMLDKNFAKMNKNFVFEHQRTE